MNESRRPFWLSWWIANAAAFSFAHLIYSPIAHGLTGAHDKHMSLAQILAHGLGHLVVAVLILGAQAAVLRRRRPVSRRRIFAGTLAYFVAFYFGWYVTGPPFDWIFGFLVLGTASWIELPTRRPLATLGAAGCWALGIAAGVGALIFLHELGVPIDQTDSLSIHTAFWVVLGGCTGIVGGLLSGPLLSRLVQPLDWRS